MDDKITMRGAVLSKFKSVSSFADTLGWKRNKASRVLNGVQEPTLSDIEAMAMALNIHTVEVFADIFFPSLSTMWTKIGD